ncbi:class I SAM-dependent methyltransferase [Taklimakanibacter deserti]|uniref:class I SAM-dependent methyltransferase n=1 Tax=Taklimakanibacter deserti TaxID=2267839 RepID=UPI000E658231
MTGKSLTIKDHYDAELARHNERLRAMTRIGSTDRVLDVGCGAGQTTREAARAASSGSVLGVDISDEMLERARCLTAEAGLHNVTYELADATVHRFTPKHFDVAISRFGTMFFADPVAGFANLASALRPGAHLVMMVWQTGERNEWETQIRQALMKGDRVVPAAPGQDPFSLGEPSIVEAILDKAGFSDVRLTDVREPVYYGPDVETAYDIIMSMRGTDGMLAALDPDTRELALQRLRATLAQHATAQGVLFDSRAWIVEARC